LFRHPVSRRFVFSVLSRIVLVAIGTAVSLPAQTHMDRTTDLYLHRFQPTVSPELAAQSASSSDLSVDSRGMSYFAAAQIAALQQEKNSRTPSQRKIDSNVLYTERMLQGMNAAPGVASLDTGVMLDANNNIVVDMVANVTGALLSKLSAADATVLYSNASMHSIRALIAPSQIEGFAALPDVIFINPMQQANHSRRKVLPAKNSGPQWNLAPRFDARAARVRAMLLGWQQSHGENTVGTPFTGQGSVETEGDIVHGAVDARGIFGINGAGLKIGVLSDGVTSAALSQATGDLPATCGTPPCLTVLSGQAGSGDEGTAMLEIVHDMAPGASLYFATADTNIASFAANIQALQAAGCNIIVDDAFYFAESPFQDGQAATVMSTSQGGAVTQAVNSVAAAGVFYFSSAGNEGNLDDATSGTFEGDFVPMAAAAPLPSGMVHNFGSGNGYDTITSEGEQVAALFWSDPLGESGNDYDLYLLDSTGTTILAASTNIQSGTQDPEELIESPSIVSNSRLVVFQNSGAANRFIHLVVFRGTLAVATSGETHGHSAASGAYTVAATPAAVSFGLPTPNGPYPGLFTAASQTESFSSDGLRHIFFNADSSAITPSNFSSTGGSILNKPDITAADGVSVTGVGGFDNPFYGTSAAAPAAASVAALVLSAKPAITAAQMKTALTTTAIDIMSPGFDRDSVYGIVMPVPAIESLGVTGSANPELGAVVATENPGNGNGTIERGEGALLTIQLQNSTGVMAATGITATLTSSTPGVTILQPAVTSYADLAAGAGPENSLSPFAFTLASDFSCGAVAQFALTLSYSGDQTRVLDLSVQTGVITITNTLGSTPAVPAGITFATGIQTGRLDRNGVASACGAAKTFPGTIAGTHTFDSYSFQACSAQCFDPILNGGAASVNLLESLYSPTFDPSNIATGYAGDAGASNSTQEFGVSLNGSTQYSLVIDDVAGNPPPAPSPSNTYTIQIPSCSIDCNVNHVPIAIAQDITVTATTFNGTASANINDGSHDPDGGAITITQNPAGPYPIGTTSVILTVTDPLGAFAQATASVTVNQPALTPPSIGEAFGATSIPLGATTSLSFSLANTNTAGSLSGVGFSDSLPAGLAFAVPSGLSSTCGAGTTVANGSTLSVSGLTLPANSTCIISVNVKAVAVGTQDNTTSTISSVETSAGNPASATLTVTQAVPGIALTSSANPAPALTPLTLTATVSSPTSTPTGSVNFFDGTTSLGSGTITAGIAHLSVPSLSSGSHSITAVYSGDTNFSTVTSCVIGDG
jgi:hypothetical protein